MLFVLIVLLLVASVFVLLMKKNRESLCLLGMCCSLMVQFSGILIFIAKKGGYSRSIINTCLSRWTRWATSSRWGAICSRCFCWKARCNTR